MARLVTAVRITSMSQSHVMSAARCRRNSVGYFAAIQISGVAPLVRTAMRKLARLAAGTDILWMMVPAGASASPVRP